MFLLRWFNPPDFTLYELVRFASEYKDDRLDRDLLSLGEILSDPADGRDLLRQVAQVSSGIFGAQVIAVVKE